MATEEAYLAEIRRRGWFGRAVGYLRLSGPGYLQSAFTLGSGTAAACLLSGWKYGYKLLWVQPAAMLLGVIVFAAIAKQTLNSDERPYAVFWNRLHPLMALAWGLSALFASIFWNIPQYAIAVSSVADLGNEFGIQNATTTTSKWIIGFAILGVCIPLSWAYSKRGRPVRIYERLIKLIVWGMVIAFAWVAVATHINWGELFKGLFSFYVPNPKTEPDGLWIMLGGLSAAVGINMVFLYPYSLRQRNWGKDHEGLAHYDLLSGMFLPFAIASTLIIIATANTIHGDPQKPASMVHLIPVLSEKYRLGPALVLGLGLFAMGLSSITAQMLAAGFTAIEMLGLKSGGWAHRLCMLLPAPVGIWGSVTLKPLEFAVYVSVGMLFYLPAAYIGFMILNNMASYMGEAMPRGRKRWLWNIGLALAIGLVAAAGLLTAYKKFQDYLESRAGAKQETAGIVPSHTSDVASGIRYAPTPPAIREHRQYMFQIRRTANGLAKKA